MKNPTLSLAIAAALTAGAMPLHVAAADVADSLEEIVVTAQRRSERLQDVPDQSKIVKQRHPVYNNGFLR